MGSATTVFKNPSLNSLFKNDFSRSLNSRFHHSYSKIIFVVNSPIYQTATVLSFTSISLDLLLLACRKKNIFFSSEWTTQSLGYHQSVPPTSSRFIKLQSQPCKETRNSIVHHQREQQRFKLVSILIMSSSLNWRLSFL